VRVLSTQSLAGNISRRDVIFGLLSSALVDSMNTPLILGETLLSPQLYAFCSATGCITIRLEALPAPGRAETSSYVRVHFGQRVWEVNLLGRGSREYRDSQVSLECTKDGVSGLRQRGVNIHIPQEAAFTQRQGVWAEYITPGEQRRRIGSPLAAGILNSNQRLRSVYHSIAPGLDREYLLPPLVQLLTSAAHGWEQAKAQRLAKFLLPDVLWFDPHAPVGFTLARQNGRRLADVIEPVVAGITTPWNTGTAI
jgi:hypothetical protein